MSDNHMEEVARLDAKVDLFMASQDRHNEQVSRNLEKLTDAVATQKAQQVEINNLGTTISDLSHKFDKFAERVGERLGSVESKQAVNMEFKKELNHAKWWMIGVGGSIIVGISVTAFKYIIELIR